MALRSSGGVSSCERPVTLPRNQLIALWTSEMMPSGLAMMVITKRTPVMTW